MLGACFANSNYFEKKHSFLTMPDGLAAFLLQPGFSNYAFYDDEGTMMMSLKRFFDGLPLYDRVGAIYGPAFYLFQWTCTDSLGFLSPTIRFASFQYSCGW